MGGVTSALCFPCIDRKVVWAGVVDRDRRNYLGAAEPAGSVDCQRFRGSAVLPEVREGLLLPGLQKRAT